MRATIVACLALVAAVSAEAEADPKPYTLYQALTGQLAPGSVVKSINGVPATLTSAPAVTYAGVHSPYVYGGLHAPYGYGGHFIGKREAEAEPEPYTVHQVLTGQVAPGSVVKSITYGHGIGAVPATLTSAPAVTYAGVHSPYVYGGLHAPYGYGGHFIGKREAEAKPEPYTVHQVLTGQVAPGSVVKSITYGHGIGAVPATLTSAPAVTYAGLHSPYVYGGLHAPYGYGGHFIGKREAEADPEPYTVHQVLTGQVAPGSVVKSITYGHGIGTVPATLTSVPATTLALPAHTYGAYSGLHAPYSAAVPALHYGAFPFYG